MKRLLGGLALAGAALAACKDSSGPSDRNFSLIDSTITAPVPPLVATVPMPTSFIHDMYVRDGIVFACAWSNGLILYDIGGGGKGGTPANPVEISRIVTALNGVSGPDVHNAWWFHNPANGEKRYVFVGQEGPATIPSQTTGDIHVVDISDMAHPAEVAYYHMGVSPAAGPHNFWMDEQAQVLFAAYYNGGVVALDVSGTLSGDLSSREITRFKPASTTFVWGVQLANNSVYLSDMLNGLYQLKYANRAFTTAGGGGNVNERFSSDLWVNSAYAYTGTWGGYSRTVGVVGNALKIWPLSSSGAPGAADSVTFQAIQTVSDVKGTTDGKLLVVSAEGGTRGGIYLFSLSDPARPKLVAFAPDANGVHTVKVADIGGKRYVFGARNSRTTQSALLIYDITAF